MEDKSARKPREHRPDPAVESDAGAASDGTGSALAASDKAQNAEIVLDPDREPEDPAREAGDQVDRLEGHGRQTTSPSHESPPPPDTPPD
jgi:hypothetical protein